jgi:beta-glucosidase
MKMIIKIRLTLFILLGTIALFSCDTSKPNYKSYSGNAEIEQKVDSVLSLMTLEEKIGQMTQFSGRGDITGPAMQKEVLPYLKKGLVGSMFNEATMERVKPLQEAALAESRLKIPVLFGYDVIHGFRTIFPMPLAESCTWDLELIKESARIAATEASAEGVSWTFAPMVDISRDARWGRVMEGAGEDVYLGKLVAKARVKGFQGEDWKDLKSINTVLACAKHFAAYGAAEAGRDYNAAEVSERTLNEIYLPPFEAAKDAGVATFMTAFNEIGGIPCSASKYLYKDVLRDRWDFRGFVVTDYTAIKELVEHGIAKDEAQAAELAANAGIDMDMTGGVYIENLKAQVEAGKVSIESINTAVSRILEMKFLLGLFDNPYRYMDQARQETTRMKPEFLALARNIAKRSVVLLKNENIFPIDKSSSKTIALIGPMIKNKTSLNGEWAGRGDRNQSVSLFEGLQEKYKDSNIQFTYAQACDLVGNDKSGFKSALSIASKADIVLVAMGEDFNWSGEAASRTNIKLPSVQQDFLKELKKLNKPTGLILMNGRPLDLSWENENVDAIIEAWYLGTTAGNALADVISGDYNPSGKLTLSFPRNIGQVPIYYNAKNTGRPIPKDDPDADYKSTYIDVENSPLYPFGYGLSYTTFSIKEVRLNTNTLNTGEKLTVNATISNTGDVFGEDVVQLYVQDLYGSVTRPVKELKGFAKVGLEPGESKEIQFTISEDDLKFFDINMNFLAEEGDFKLWVSSNSSDESNELSFQFKH